MLWNPVARRTNQNDGRIARSVGPHCALPSGGFASRTKGERARIQLALRRRRSSSRSPINNLLWRSKLTSLLSRSCSSADFPSPFRRYVWQLRIPRGAPCRLHRPSLQEASDGPRTSFDENGSPGLDFHEDRSSLAALGRAGRFKGLVWAHRGPQRRSAQCCAGWSQRLLESQARRVC